MAKFTIYTYQFSPLAVVQGELFPTVPEKSLDQLHAECHRIFGKFFKAKPRYFSVHSASKDYSCMMLANQDGVIVMRIADEKHDRREIHFKVFREKDQPSCLVIIDNHEGGMQTVCIQNRSQSFLKTQDVAVILESAINDYLQHYRLRVSIRAGYVVALKWCDTVGESPQSAGRLEFRLPYPYMPQTGDVGSGIEKLSCQAGLRGEDCVGLPVPESARSEGHTLEVDELVRIVCETHSENCYEQVIHVLSRYNDHHGHRFQQAVDRLRSRLDALRSGLTTPRLTEQVVVENGGMNISRSHFEEARFGLAAQGGVAPHKMLDSH